MNDRVHLPHRYQNKTDNMRIKNCPSSKTSPFVKTDLGVLVSSMSLFIDVNPAAEAME